MCSSCDHYPLSFWHIFNILLACYDEIIAFVTSKRITEGLPLAKLLLDWVTHDSIQIVLAICVCVRIAICKVDCIVWVLKDVLESMGKKRTLGAAFI